MAIIEWVEGSSGSAELLVGANNESFPDVLNRPLKQIMSISLADPNADFQGFALAGSAGFVSASYATTASYALNGGTGGGSTVTFPIVAGPYSSGSGQILNPGGIVSASYSVTASYALNGGGGGASVSASFATNALTANSATSASYAYSASFAVSSSFANNVGVVNAGQIIGISGSVINPNLIISASFATTAAFANTTPHPVLRVTNSYTASLTDYIISFSGSNASCSLYLPGVSANSGYSYLVRVSATNNGWPLRIVPSGSDTIDGFSSITLTTPRSTVSLTSNGITEWIAGGSGSYTGVSVATASFAIGVGPFTPSATGDASGVVGQITYDSSFVYIKTAAGWKRAALSTF